MARLRTLILLLTGCGRLGFDAAGSSSDAALASDSNSGHDEDGDGLVDDLDPCPHLPGSDDDVDQDGIGDACDPEPDLPRQRLAAFYTFQHVDGLSFITMDGGRWELHADSLGFTGAFGHLELPLAFQDVALHLGVDILAINLGPDAQHQFSAGLASDQLPSYQGELNEVMTFRVAEITQFDGVDYNNMGSRDLVNGMHTGSVAHSFVAFASATPTAHLRTGWPGEPYAVDAAIPSYTGGRAIQININALDLELRHLWVVTNR